MAKSFNHKQKNRKRKASKKNGENGNNEFTKYPTENAFINNDKPLQKKQKRPTGINATNNSKGSALAQPSFPQSHPHPHAQNLPLPFPSHLPVPKDDFLRDEPPYEASFQTALETSYLGLAVDEPRVLQQKQQQKSTTKAPPPPLQTTLPRMNDHCFFQTDVTQPFGLGTKCAKTYVTRCLVGDPGTSYKYLGLRMFAHSWDKGEGQGDNDNTGDQEQRQLLQSIRDLKDGILVPQTKRHLKELHAKRQSFALPSYDIGRSRPQYNICLINRMVDSQQQQQEETSNAKQTTVSNGNSSFSTPTSQFKLEPTFEKDRIAVAWHADSSLEHYSNIAVYQLLEVEQKTENEPTSATQSLTNYYNNNWSLALRVTPNAEGPNLPKAGADQCTPDSSIPALCLTLPSGSAYYMLDDFNHHHQHAVLRDGKGQQQKAFATTMKDTNDKAMDKTRKKTKNKENVSSSPQSKHDKDTSSTAQDTGMESSTATWIRYSATYRLLRPSHTVQEVLDQCQRACRAFHKRGMKVWRSEQLLLTYMESEWLRQFYIQGQHHHDMLCQYGQWGTFMTQLWKYWSQLEQRTQQILDLLQHAAEGKCFYSNNNCNSNNGGNNKDNKNNERNSGNGSGTAPTKGERKRRDKQKKAYATVQDLLSRSSSSSSVSEGNNTALTDLYEPMAELLEERATMRTLWRKREKDHVFTTLERQYRPLPLPIQYDYCSHHDTGGNDGVGSSSSSIILATSPLPEDIGPLATQLRAFGRAYQSGSVKDLPPMSRSISAALSATPKNNEINGSTTNTDTKRTVHPTDDNINNESTEVTTNNGHPKKSRQSRKRNDRRDQHGNNYLSSNNNSNNNKRKKKKRRF